MCCAQTEWWTKTIHVIVGGVYHSKRLPIGTEDTQPISNAGWTGGWEATFSVGSPVTGLFDFDFFQGTVGGQLSTSRDYCKLLTDTSDVRLRVDDKYVVQITCAFRCNGIWPRSASHWPNNTIPWPNPAIAAEVSREEDNNLWVRK